MMNNDIVYLLEWWFLFFLVGVVSIPFSWLLFKKFVDFGYGVAKTLGFLIITYLTFIGGISHLFPFDSGWLFSILAIYFLVNFAFFLKKRKEIIFFLRRGFKTILAQEFLFSAGYLFWSLVRSYQPDIRGLEKFMDYGFINSILISEYFPPGDMWLSGATINYYWFGHLWVSVATKLANIPPAVTFNLMLATILGLTLNAAFSISTSLIKNLDLKIRLKITYIAGIISALLLVFGGSFHTPIYALKEGVKTYWYPDATRFIGYHPEINDKTIHEFPQYSFVVSDLHAHLLNLPFVLLYIALLYSYISEIKHMEMNSKHETQSTKQYSNPNSQNSKRFGKLKFKILNLFGISDFGFRIFPSKLIPLGFLLGVMFMTNTWDFGNYLLVTIITLILFNLITQKIKLNDFLNLMISLGIIVSVGLITALPFILSFTSIAQGIAFVKSHTPLWQLGVLWGFPAILTVIYFFFLYRIRRRLEPSDIFTISLLTSSWILIVLPEIIYVKDIYIASHHRANTMFKLTYQAFVMLYISVGYITVRTLTLIKSITPRILLGVFYATIFSSILAYSYFAINSYYGGLRTYRGLSGETWLKDIYSSEGRAILWLRKNVPNQSVILEAPGDSYTDNNVISAYTGLPTISGWFVHEWLWRGSPDISQKRAGDVAEIYTSKDTRLTKELLKNYQVDYVIVSTFERDKYPNLYEPKFKMLGKMVFSSGATTIYQILN